MINVVTTMIVALVALGDIANGAGHRRWILILMIMHPVPVLAHAMHVVMEATPGLRTTLDPAPLWRAVVITVIRQKVAHTAPVVPVSLKGAGMMGQGLCQVILKFFF